MKTFLFIFLVFFTLLVCSCEMTYKEKTYKEVCHTYSSVYGKRDLENEFKAKNDSSAYIHSLIYVILDNRNNEDDGRYKAVSFDLYDSDGNLVIAPNFSDSDLESIAEFGDCSKDEVLQLIYLNHIY